MVVASSSLETNEIGNVRLQSLQSCKVKMKAEY